MIPGKIKTLRLATSYIGYLSEVLSGDDPSRTPAAFTAEISRKLARGDEKRKKELLVRKNVYSVIYSDKFILCDKLSIILLQFNDYSRLTTKNENILIQFQPSHQLSDHLGPNTIFSIVFQNETDKSY